MADSDKLQNTVSHRTFDAVKWIQNKAAKTVGWEGLGEPQSGAGGGADSHSSPAKNGLPFTPVPMNPVFFV